MSYRTVISCGLLKLDLFILFLTGVTGIGETPLSVANIVVDEPLSPVSPPSVNPESCTHNGHYEHSNANPYCGLFPSC